MRPRTAEPEGRAARASACACPSRRLSTFHQLWQPRKVHAPVDLPGLAAVGRVSLLPMCRILGDLRPDVPSLDGFPIERVVTLERADTVLKVPNYRRTDLERIALVQPPDRPGLRLWIVSAYAHPVIGVDRLADVVVVHIAVSIQRRPIPACAVKFHPFVIVGKTLL